MTVYCRLSSSFNGYARAVLQRLVGNFEHVSLDFYAPDLRWLGRPATVPRWACSARIVELKRVL